MPSVSAPPTSSGYCVEMTLRLDEQTLAGLQEAALARFLRYVAIDTRADPDSGRHPSSAGQLTLARLMAEELAAMRRIQTELDDHGYLYVTVPARHSESSISLTFCAHFDTSPAVSGTDVKPIVRAAYDGGALRFPDDPDLLLTPRDAPALKRFVGQDIVTASGQTLLGADDKAGLAAIMTALAALEDLPDWPHPQLQIVFTPDEEIGQGADLIRADRLGDVGYTIDGGEMGELEAECFHALKAVLVFKGLNVHPGYAKGCMVNAAAIAARLAADLPAWETPEHTEGREGFFHLTRIRGDESLASLELILRDFDPSANLQRHGQLERLADVYRLRYPGLGLDLAVSEQYRNMKEVLDQHPAVIQIARQAIADAGITVIDKSIRGGTDGARLSFMGMPTPNLFAGGHLFHSRKEWIPVSALQKSAEVILNLCRLWATTQGPTAFRATDFSRRSSGEE
jgi:tripeptide aminopeptidase